MVGGLLVLAVSLRFLSSDDGDEPAEPILRSEEAVTFAVTLQAGYDDPVTNDPTTGQRLPIPRRTEALVVAAPAGESVAIRIGPENDLGEWIELGHDDDEGPDGVEDHDPGPSGDDHRRIGGRRSGPGGEEFRSELRALPPVLIEEGDTTVEIVHLAGAGHGLQANFLLASDDEADGPPVVAGRLQAPGPAAPAISPRSAWTDKGWAGGNSGCQGGPWYAQNLQAVVVHHTVTSNSYRQDQVDDLLRAIRFSHVDVNGWCDVGYNFLVDRFGTIWEGRSGGVDQPVIGGHAKGFNTSTMGVALLGQHQPRARPTAARPAAAAEQAVDELARWKLSLHGIDPAGRTWLKNRSARGPQRLASGQWHLVPTIMGHRHLGLTSCPGDHGLDLVAQLAAELDPPTAENGVHRFASWSPHPHGPAFVAVDGRGELRAAGGGVIAAAEPGDAPVAPPSPAPKAVAAVMVGDRAQGWTLHGDGMLHPFGGAPASAERPAGDRQVVDLALADGGGGWVVATDGGIFGFGGQPDLVGQNSVGPIGAADLTGRGDGYLLDVDGRLSAVGAAPTIDLGRGVGRLVDVAVHPSGQGGWVAQADGVIHHFGSAPPVEVTSPGGSIGPHPVVAILAANGGGGGWLATADGQLWPFGRERLVLPLTTDATGGAVVDVALAGSHLPDAFVNGDDGRYLTELSQLFRGRPATPDEQEKWDGWLAYRGGRMEVTLELARSPEWVSRQLDQMYRDVLGRAPDPDGLRYWQDRVATGMTVSEVGVWFYGSPEYVASAGTTEAYVELLYQQLLGRSSDAAGLANWVQVIESGRAGPAAVAAAFYRSSEYRRQQATALFTTVLGRLPERDAVVYWAHRLGQTDDVIIAAELAASEEFYRRSLE